MDLDEQRRWPALDAVLARNGYFVGQTFVAGAISRELITEVVRVLVVGAGGLGCELLKDLAFSGFLNLDVIDLDTVDISNLNRQFLFGSADVGRPKAEVAAEKIQSRIPGTTVTPHFCRIEDKPIEFFEDFDLFVLGLDSLEARRYMNSIACSFTRYDDDGQANRLTMKPIIDGGTEGFKGHARVIFPGTTPCFECTLWLFPPQIRFPMCTLAETPRTAAHCIEYVHQVLWGKKRLGETFDPDNTEHMQWMYKEASERADFYGIPGVTYQLTQGVVKNIIPAIASSNAIISGMCALEALKLLTSCSTPMQNYTMYATPVSCNVELGGRNVRRYTGSDGIYTHTVAYEPDPQCPVCSPGIPITINPEATLNEFIEKLMEHPSLGAKLKAPSVSLGETPLFMRGAFEASTAGNLLKTMSSLVPETNSILYVNDKSLTGALRFKLLYEDVEMDVGLSL